MNVTPLQPADAEAFARMRCELYTTDDASEVREEALAFLRTGEFAGINFSNYNATSTALKGLLAPMG